MEHVVARAGDPSIDLQELADIALHHPEARVAVAGNPAAYDGLLEWLGQLGDPAINAVLVGRGITPANSATAELGQAPQVSPVPAGTPRSGLIVGVIVASVILVAGGIGAAVAVNASNQQRAAEAEQQTYVDEEPFPEIEADPTLAPVAPPPAPSVIAGSDGGVLVTYTNQSGYSYTSKMTIGAPQKYVAGATHPGSSANLYGSGCSIDPQTDVVIPVTWTATATTAGYDTDIQMSALIYRSGVDYTGAGIAPFDGDSRIGIEQYFSSGPKCTTESSTNIWGYGHSDGFGVSFNDPVPTGSSVSHSLTIVIHNYYTPATPDGDTALLSWISIRGLFGGSNTDAATMYTPIDGYLGLYANQGVALDGTAVTY